MKQNINQWGILSALVYLSLALGVSQVAQGALILQTQDAGGFGSDWNVAIWGSPAAAPTSGNDYATDGNDVRNTNNVTFGGDTLRVDAGSTVITKQDATVTGGWFLNGGTITNGDRGNLYTIGGDVAVQAASIIQSTKGSLSFTGQLLGGADLSVNFLGEGVDDQYISFEGGGAYSGTITAGETADTKNFDGWELRLAQSLANATVVIGADTSYDLSNSITVAGFTADSVTLSAGTYDATDLANAGISSFVDNGGTLTIAAIPEPSALLFLGSLLGLLAVWRRPRR